MQNHAPLSTFSLSGHQPKKFKVARSTIAKINLRHDFGDFAARAIVACLSKAPSDRGKAYSAANQFFSPPGDLVEVDILVSSDVDLAIDADLGRNGHQPSRDAVVRACIDWYFAQLG